MYPYPNPSIITKGLSLLKSIKWSSILDGTGKTLGVINQAIPIIYQIKPILGNAKTFMKIASTINSDDKVVEKEEPIIDSSSKTHNSPIFYID